jgi:hypothetical protein
VGDLEAKVASIDVRRFRRLGQVVARRTGATGARPEDGASTPFARSGQRGLPAGSEPTQDAAQ